MLLVLPYVPNIVIHRGLNIPFIREYAIDTNCSIEK